MTAQEIIEKIRAEVNRLKGLYNPNDYDDAKRIETLAYVEDILSDLEKECEEKPTNIDFEQELYKHFGQVKDFTLGMQIAKHFYELGRQEKPTTAEGLEEEIERYLSTEWELDEDLNKDEPIYIYDGTWEDLKILARHFAQWGAEHAREQSKPKACEECPSRGNTHSYLKGLEDGKKEMKEQMMKEAVEGIVTTRSMAGNIVTAHIDHQFKDGQKVRIIIVKEDEK